MTHLLRLIRRHPRLLAALAPILLAAGAGIGLGASGSGHVQPARPVAATAVARTSFLSLPRSRSRRAPRTAATAVVASARPSTPRHHSRHAAVATAPPVRPGIRTPAPTSHAVALALRQATGLSLSQVSVRGLCPPAGAGYARCAGESLVLRSDGAPVHPFVAPASSGAAPAAGTPAYLQQAYDLSSLSQNAGTRDTVAIVDAYDDPTAQSDLDKFRSTYQLPACDSGCFTKVNEQGNASPLPAASSSWEQEISLDLDAVSAICPNCHILLVEASTSSSTDMQSAMQTAAATPGVKQISDSWTMTSSSVPAGQYTFPGIATVAATGDEGYLGTNVDNYPAALPNVTAAGGTSLAPATGAANARGFGETAWSDAGSGCDVAVSKPSWQGDTGCTGRSYADLSADADPYTGLNVVDDNNWVPVSGTSLATPLIAAYYAITGVNDTSPQWAYGVSGALNDVVSGSNGSCAAGISYICNAGTGYDGPTGVGSISGAAVTGAPGIGGPAIVSGSANTYTEGVAAHGATIAAGIYRNGLDTTWSIQYGITNQYGSQTQPVDVGAGSAPVAITGYLSGLTPATKYHYRLVAQNSAGMSYGYDYTFTTSTAPGGTPTASFTSAPTAPSPSAPVTFNASASIPGTGLTYSWNFGDGSTGSGETPSHTFARGTYAVSLTVTSGSKSDTSTQTVTVDNPPTAAFTPSAPASGPTAVSFDASASAAGAGAGAQIKDYNWNFGDGTTVDAGTSTSGAHTYASPGTYTVTLTTTDDLNVTGTVSQTVTVGSFTATPAVPAPGGVVSFSAANTSGITDYSWNFGDGITTDAGTSTSTAHTYSAPGQYTVTLTTTNGTGQTVTASEIVTVDNPPNADLPSSSIIAAPGATVTLNGGSSAAAGPETIKYYTWNFGDGSAPLTSNSPAATHVYSTPNHYTATLMVTDNLGVTATTAATQQVIVDQPAPAFTPSAAAVAPNAGASFDASGSNDPEGTIADYSWNFGDGSSQDTNLTSSATHSYGARGVKTVTLTITNSYGQTASTTHTVTVDNPPAPAFTPSATVATTNAALDFNGSASTAMTGGSIADYSWNFGDGSTSTSATSSAAHAYAGAGTYNVTLTTTDDLGLSASTSEQVTIQVPPVTSTPTPPASSTTTTPTPSPAPAPTASSSPTPTPTPAPLTASLGAAKKQRLTPALAHGLRLSLSVSQGVRASFLLTLPVSESRLPAGAHKPKTSSIVLLRTGAQAFGGGSHAVTLKLSKAAAHELAGSGPLVVTVKMTLSGASGATVTRTVKITLAR